MVPGKFLRFEGVLWVPEVRRCFQGPRELWEIPRGLKSSRGPKGSRGLGDRRGPGTGSHFSTNA